MFLCACISVIVHAPRHMCPWRRVGHRSWGVRAAVSYCPWLVGGMSAGETLVGGAFLGPTSGCSFGGIILGELQLVIRALVLLGGGR